REHLDQLDQGEVIEEGRGLQLDADPALHLLRRLEDVDPRDDGATTIGLAQTLENFDGGGLAGPVRSQQAEDHALLHPARYAVDRDKITISLSQPLDDDGEALGIQSQICLLGLYERDQA